MLSSCIGSHRVIGRTTNSSFQKEILGRNTSSIPFQDGNGFSFVRSSISVFPSSISSGFLSNTASMMIRHQTNRFSTSSKQRVAPLFRRAHSASATQKLNTNPITSTSTSTSTSNSKNKESMVSHEGVESEDEVEEMQEDEHEMMQKIRDLSLRLFLASRRIGSVKLPSELSESIQKLLKGYSKELLKLDADNLSQSLRERTRVRPEEAIFKLDRSSSVYTDSPLGGAHHYKEGDSVAYVAHRLPGIYSCMVRVLKEITTARPDFKPKTMLDFGTGPATGVWATREMFKDSLFDFRLIEPSEEMQTVAKKLLGIDSPTIPPSSPPSSPSSPSPPQKKPNTPKLNLEWRRFLFETDVSQSTPQYDIVMASYSLSELPTSKVRNSTVRALWSHVKPGGFLIGIEPGTPIGFAVIREARDLLLFNRSPVEGRGGVGGGGSRVHVLAPCPHSQKCPMATNSWCHFVQRMERTPWQLTAKAKSHATLNWEDEKFSYVILEKLEDDSLVLPSLDPEANSSRLGQRKGKETEEAEEDEAEAELREKALEGYDSELSRLVRHPLRKAKHGMMTVCTPRVKIEHHLLTKKKHPLAYRALRRSTWGDGIRVSEETKTDNHPKLATNKKNIPSIRKQGTGVSSSTTIKSTSSTSSSSFTSTATPVKN